MKRKLVISMRPWPKPKGGPHRVVCHFCDTLHESVPVPEGTAARCVRCDALLYQNRCASLVRATSFSLTALVLMIIVHTFPFMSMDAGGMRTTLTPMGAASALINDGSPIVGCAVALFTMLTPLVMSGGLIYVCGPLLWGKAAPGAMRVARWLTLTEPWNMIEVFLLGVLVSLMKLGKMADLHFGVGFWAFACLMVAMAAAVAGIDREELWDRLEVARE
ncbi:MAG: paraquat-inducible protein A [Akkermansiaceae bacterium]|nr:paraquat-inducible protein A [Akkermansiaceae bacterium]